MLPTSPKKMKYSDGGAVHVAAIGSTAKREKTTDTLPLPPAILGMFQDKGMGYTMVHPRFKTSLGIPLRSLLAGTN